jgi:phosphoglycerate dehydrogenase-like enzyme
MKTILLHAATFARLAARLKPFERQIDVIVLGDDGQFQRPSTGETVAAPAPHIAFGNTDVWFGGQAQPFLRTLIGCGTLEWFQSSAAGVEHPALMMIGKAARAYTTNHTQSEAMAEWALWQALDFLRAGPAHRAQAAAGNWTRMPAREIAGSAWLIIGYGAIGAAVGKRVGALGGHVTGLRRSPGPAIGADRIVPPADLMAELTRADIVLLAAPHTPETENLANAAFFAAMQPSALFLNLGRGALVDEAALIAALDAGRPAFAALDVTRAEPLPADSPLWRHPRLAITPHDSADTPASALRADATFLANLARYLAGEPLHHRVDPATF